MMDTSIEMNDDEAERAIRRRTLAKSATNVNTSLTNENLVEEQQGLQNCLKIFHDNKISKENAWTLTLIDNMANLCRSHHKTLRNFSIVGSSLEASTKIYGLRVDSVHSDIVRMSSGLGRMKTDTPSVHDNEDNDDNKHNITQATTEQPKTKRKRVRKAISTVTKNKESLNSRLDINQMPDALYFKLNSIMGETSSSNKLLLNIIETNASDLRLTMTDLYWDTREFDEITFSADNNYDLDDAPTELPLKINASNRFTLRQQLSSYTISNTPLDDDDDVPPTQDDNTSFNITQCMHEYAFDMAAGLEPIPDTDTYQMDYDMDCDGGNDFDEMSPDDRTAIQACKGLRRKATIIEDLRPDDATKLEYSYRPLDNINQFWAGPSYWKFRKSRKLTMNSNSIASSMDGGRCASQNTAQAMKRRNRAKVEPTKFTKLVENVRDSEQGSDDGLFISIDSKAAQKFKKTHMHKRWDSKKLKLPTDLHVDRNLFNYYTYCPSYTYCPVINGNPNATPVNETDHYDYDNNDDAAYCTDVRAHDADGVDQDVDIMDDHKTNVPDIEVRINEQIPDSQNTQSDQEISHHYEGAPETVQKIDIQFARRAKVIDMKQMKSVCLNTIERQFEKTAQRTFSLTNTRHEEAYKDGAASFGILYNSLPHLLTKTMAENLSPSVAFYSILHLANEHRLRLYNTTKENDMNVFLIRQLDK